MKKLGWIKKFFLSLFLPASIVFPESVIAIPAIVEAEAVEAASSLTTDSIHTPESNPIALIEPFIVPTAVETPASVVAQDRPAPPPLEVESGAEPTPLVGTVFPVGININRRSAIQSVLIRGQEDGSQAIDFLNWLIPYDAVIRALNITTQALPNGQVRLSSRGFVVQIDPETLRIDDELGTVFSVQDLERLFGIDAEFDINEYAIQLDVPWFTLAPTTGAPVEAPVVLEGLPLINAPVATLSAIQQRVNVSGTETTQPSYRGNLTAVGTFLGGSTYFQLDQPDLQSDRSWLLREARFQRQTDFADYILGTQPPFWLTRGTGDYVGFTTIQRDGFIPPRQLFGESDPRSRLQASRIGRTISGRAEPGTLVRLVQGFGDRVIAEVLVDSSGIFRFQDVPVDRDLFTGNYRVLLYPQGQLTAQPEIQDISLLTVQGQLPEGAAALVVSGGFGRELSATNPGLIGNFRDFRGGVAQRWGVSETLTLGLGGVYDQSLRGYAELFFQPTLFPLQVSLTALTGAPWNFNAYASYFPPGNFSANLFSDEFSTRFTANLRVARGVSLVGALDTRDGASVGTQLSFSGRNFFTLASARIDTQNRFRWSLFQRLQRLELRSFGNEIGLQSELSYSLSPTRNLFIGPGVLLRYERRNNPNDELLTAGVRYRSPGFAFEGGYLFDAELGYGVGSRGSGIVASAGVNLIRGLQVRARYQGVSLLSDTASFNIELVPTLNFQQGVSPGDRRIDYLRTQGGLLVQPFLDRNGDGRPDEGDEFFTDPNLLVINNRPVSGFRADIRDDRILVFLPPGVYRLDLDPAGFPPDLQPTVDALAVEVVAGAYTPVVVPLLRSFTRVGVVTNPEGQPLAGARVEAVQQGTGVRVFSITNEAGVFYLERIQEGTHDLLVNGEPAVPATITLDQSTELFQELNLQRP